MSEKKYWVIINQEYQPELFENVTWNEAQQKITAGRLYSGFTSQEKAEEVFNKLNAADLEPDPAKAEEKIADKIKNLQDKQIMLFTDGSYRDVSPKKYGAGWGYVGLHKENGKLVEDSEHNCVLTSESRQVSGETAAVDEALSYAIMLGCTKVDIYCDLLDLILWDCGFNKADKDVAKDYVENMKDYHNKLDITFHWTPSHEGIEYNEKVDAEAKAGFEDAPTEEQLRDRLDQLQDELDGLYESVRGWGSSDYDDADSVIGDTGRLTDDQDAYDAAVDNYSQIETSNEIDEYEREIAKIKKVLGIEDEY